MTVTIAIDMDGVIAPSGIAQNELPTSWSPAQFFVINETYGMVAARPVRDLLIELDSHPEVEASWHTSWREDVYTDLVPSLGAGETWPQFATRAEHRCLDQWWKLAAVRRWLDEHSDSPHDHLIWIDDDIAEAITSGEIDQSITSNTQLSMISPSHWRGLTSADLSWIRDLVQQHTT